MVERVTAQYDGSGVRAKSRRKPRGEWLTLQPGAHDGYIDWQSAEAIRRMVSENVPTSRHHGAPKHGDAPALWAQADRPLQRREAQHSTLCLPPGPAR